jgi:hypothetical protein
MIGPGGSLGWEQKVMLGLIQTNGEIKWIKYRGLLQDNYGLVNKRPRAAPPARSPGPSGRSPATSGRSPATSGRRTAQPTSTGQPEQTSRPGSLNISCRIFVAEYLLFWKWVLFYFNSVTDPFEFTEPQTYVYCKCEFALD